MKAVWNKVEQREVPEEIAYQSLYSDKKVVKHKEQSSNRNINNEQETRYKDDLQFLNRFDRKNILQL